MSVVADESGISERTLWRYIEGKIPEKIPKLPDLCEVIGCHASELLTPEWKQVYEGLLIDVDNLVFEDDTEFLEKSSELRGWSREIREWQIFFESGVFKDVSEVEASEAEAQDEDLLEVGDAPEISDEGLLE